jgi:hypothetical protein
MGWDFYWYTCLMLYFKLSVLNFVFSVSNNQLAKNRSKSNNNLVKDRNSSESLRPMLIQFTLGSAE